MTPRKASQSQMKMCSTTGSLFVKYLVEDCLCHVLCIYIKLKAFVINGLNGAYIFNIIVPVPADGSDQFGDHLYSLHQC